MPTLADLSEYIASEASFYRVWKSYDLLAHRGRSKPRNVGRPRETHRSRFSASIAHENGPQPSLVGTMKSSFISAILLTAPSSRHSGADEELLHR